MKRQKGFTLIEMLVVVAIAALIALGASMGIGQVFKVSKQDNDMSASIRQAQNVGYWISHDALMAASVEPGSGNVKVTIGWSTWGTATDYIYEVQYKWLASGSLYKVQRELRIYDENGVPQPSMNKTMLIADNISQLDIVPDGTSWKLTVGASYGSQNVTREYQVNPRVNY